MRICHLNSFDCVYHHRATKNNTNCTSHYMHDDNIKLNRNKSQFQPAYHCIASKLAFSIHFIYAHKSLHVV